MQALLEPSRGAREPILPVGDRFDRMTGHVARVAVEGEVERVPGREDVGALVAVARPDEQVVPAVPFDHERRLGDRHGGFGGLVGVGRARLAPVHQVVGPAEGHDVPAAGAGQFGVVHHPRAADPQHHRVTCHEPRNSGPDGTRVHTNRSVEVARLMAAPSRPPAA